MEIFTIYMSPDEYIFKGSEFNPLENPLNSDPLWFGNLKTASSYGKFIFKYKTKKMLKLIDITNHNFHIDFINKVNKYFEKDPDIRNKALLLATLGLPDFETQRYYLKKKIIIEDQENKNHIDMELPFFHHKHRFSTYQLDKRMASYLKKLYPSFDGYISELLWPSYFHQGFFGKEICIFDSNQTLEFIGNIQIKEGGFRQNIHKYDKYIIHQPEKMYWNMKEYKDYKKKYIKPLKTKKKPNKYISNKEEILSRSKQIIDRDIIYDVKDDF